MTYKQNKCPSKACICIALTSWVIISAVILVAMSLVYLMPYVRIARYRQMMCKIETSFYTTQFMCSCGPECRARYPCLLVHVSVNDTSGTMWILPLFVDDFQQEQVMDTESEFYERCSVRICTKDLNHNRAMIDDFHKKYGKRQSIIPCYIDPGDMEWGAVLKRHLDGYTVLHAMIWPIVGFILSSFVCFLFCNKCTNSLKDTEKEGTAETTPPPEITLMVPGPQEITRTVPQETTETVPLEEIAATTPLQEATEEGDLTTEKAPEKSKKGSMWASLWV